MIITKEINIRINPRNVHHYNELGYKCNVNDIVIINPMHIPKMSHIKIIVSCDFCQLEKETSIKSYWRNYNRQNIYTCRKCSKFKREKTCLDKYGVKSVSQLESHKEKMKDWMSSDEFKSKSKETCLIKYGVDNYSKTEEFSQIMIDNKDDRSEKIKESNKETCLKKYGVDNYMLTNDFRDKSKETMLKKHGVEYSMQADIIKEKARKSFLEKYGVDNPFKSKEIQDIIKTILLERYDVDNVFQSEEIKQKTKKSLIEKYGVDNPMKSKRIQEKAKLTMVEKYNVEYPMRNDNIKKKTEQTRIDRGLQSKPSDLTEFQKYRNKISNLTNKNKQQLFDKWNGYDYYDNSYIKENFNLHFTSKEYPTIDHKISILYGFLNKISPKEISSIENLCVTKRSINSKKGSKCYQEFINTCIDSIL